MLSNKTNDKIKNFDNLILSKPLVQIFNNQAEEDVSHSSTQLIQTLIRFNSELNKTKIKFKKNKKVEKAKFNIRRGTLHQLPFSELLKEENVSGFLKVNQFAGITYFDKERFESLVEWLFQLIVIKSFSVYEKELASSKEKKKKSKKSLTKQELERLLLNVIKSCFASAQNLIWLAEESGYELEKFSTSLINVTKEPKTGKKEQVYAG